MKEQLKSELLSFLKKCRALGTAKGSAPMFVDYLDKGLTTEDIVSVMAALTKEVFLEKHGRQMTANDERALFRDLREWIN